MKHSWMFPVLVAALGLTLGCEPASQTPNTEQMIAGANALDQAFAEAFNSGDAEAVASLYWNDPGVVSFSPDALQARGWSEVKAGYAHFSETMAGAKLELTEGHQIPAGDFVIGWGLWRMTMPTPDGSEMEIVGRYTDVKAERDGKWGLHPRSCLGPPATAAG